jgi:peroxiredoxin family protein
MHVMATTTTRRSKESLPPGEPAAEKPASSDDLMERIAALEARVAELEEMPARDVEDRLAMVVFSGNMDRAIAAFIIATGAVAMGLETSIFFTFWGLSVIKKQKRYVGKNFLQRAFTAMLPAGTTRLGLSQKNFMGAGARIMRKMMRDHNVTSLEDLVKIAQEFGVRMVACDMTRELMGISDEEMMDGVEKGGVATFLGDASRAKVTLFI